LGHVNRTLACDLTLAGRKTQIRTPKKILSLFCLQKKKKTFRKNGWKVDIVGIHISNRN